MAFWPKNTPNNPAAPGAAPSATTGKTNGSAEPAAKTEPAQKPLEPVNAGASAAKALLNGEQPVTPEVAAKISELRTKIQLSVGQIVLSVMNLPRYRHQSLADLAHILIEPLLRDRVAIAHKIIDAPSGTPGGQLDAGTAPRANKKADEDSVAGIAIWATVSDAVDAKITEQIRAGAFPVRLGVDDWTSGETVWLLDVVAGDRKQATSVLANFRQLAGERPVKIHPIVGRLIDPAVLEKLRNAEKTETLAAKAPAGK